MMIYCRIKVYYEQIDLDKNYLSKWEWSINNPKKFQVKLYLKEDGRAYIGK